MTKIPKCDICLYDAFLPFLVQALSGTNNARMLSVIYWDCVAWRIRKVMDILQKHFSVLSVPTFADITKHQSFRSVCAVVVGCDDSCLEKAAVSIRKLKSSVSLPIFLISESIMLDTKNIADDVFFYKTSSVDQLGEKIQDTVLGKAPAEIAQSIMPAFQGKSAAVRKVIQQVEQYAPYDNPVLILGETGTGKELVARALHENSMRKGKPFIPLNCSAIPETLIESELFGTVKGAFTDAIYRCGAFSRASSGSLFLDELGSMSLIVQPRLLRVLESGEFVRVGGEKIEKSDFRLISASCRNPLDLSDAGLFRHDLMFRISDLIIMIPPLRERREDIIDLAHHFCAKLSLNCCDLSENALEKLYCHHWPGNVRELRTVISRACVHTREGTISEHEIIFHSEFKNILKDCPLG